MMRILGYAVVGAVVFPACLLAIGLAVFWPFVIWDTSAWSIAYSLCAFGALMGLTAYFAEEVGIDDE